jgi:hypothetical protein
MEQLFLRLFEECISTMYREVENAASYCYRRERAEDGERLLIFFEKSHGVVDWMNNLDFSAHPYEDMDPVWKCHAGFLKVWNSVKKYLIPHILDPGITEATVVGYSHGGALATLCHEYLWFHRPDLRERLLGVGFGAPRVLYGCVPPSIALRWDRFFVVRNADDPVTHLPPRFAGYCHVGNLFEIGNKEDYGGIDAHRPESYLAELKKLTAPLA